MRVKIFLCFNFIIIIIIIIIYILRKKNLN